MILLPRKGAPRRPWLGLLAVFVVAIALWLQRGTATPEPGASSTEPPAAATTTRETAPAAGSRAEGTSESRGFGADVGFRLRQRWMEHWDKHGREFVSLGVRDAEGYLAAAQALRDAPAGGDVLEQARADGVITRFDRSTGAFLAFNRDGTIRTFFRPNDGEAYFRRQARRE